MTDTELIWKIKTLARVHDPAEKAIVLLRDPAGHEGGTVEGLRKDLLGETRVPGELIHLIRKADHWASAADRPQFPKADSRGGAAWWSKVNFSRDPILYHPLSGEELDLRTLEDVRIEDIKAVSLDLFSKLIVKDAAGAADWKSTCLSLWRYGPENPHESLGVFWRYLPADTRVPDHTIWDHLDLCSAFAGAFAADPQNVPALLTMSIGPVQSFISQARSVSDMWAASHLLSTLAWSAMKVICEEVGPDAVIFPQLRGVPVVDLWLHHELGIEVPEMVPAKWRERWSDANPLFRAALPNKFVAVVPASAAEELASRAARAIRDRVRETALKALDLIFRKAGESAEGKSACVQQVEAQLESFPEIHWVVVPWSLVREDANGHAESTHELSDALATFYPEGADKPGFLGSEIWKLVKQGGERKDSFFFAPNAGTLYPALYDLGDRMFAAAKSARPFGQNEQEGFRCTVCGEREWLATDRSHLNLSPRDGQQTIWAKLFDANDRWARKGDHLCALCTLKRLWPDIFVAEVNDALGLKLDRYVVSTHTMALSTTLGAWLDRVSEDVLDDDRFVRLSEFIRESSCPRSALPLSLHITAMKSPSEVRDLVERLPAYLDQRREDARSKEGEERAEALALLRDVENAIGKLIAPPKPGKGDKLAYKPEAYYALIMADGDNMGAWISGHDPRYGVAFGDTWHPQLRSAFSDKGDMAWFSPFLGHTRPPSPARHGAISSALNSFSLDLCGVVVEELFKGKLIYAGGDDLLAMVSIDDLLACMLVLRLVYSGQGIGRGKVLGSSFRELGISNAATIEAERGYVLLNRRLHRVMTPRATASFGAVVAHHTAPLSAVLRELRAAEKRAKETGKDSFSLSLMKRAGGWTVLTLPWRIPSQGGDHSEKTPMETLVALRNLLGHPAMSRRAGYIIQQWAAALPGPEMLGGEERFRSLLRFNVEFQLSRQYAERDKTQCRDVADWVAGLLASKGLDNTDRTVLLSDIFTVAEFLAREGRLSQLAGQGEVSHD